MLSTTHRNYKSKSQQARTMRFLLSLHLLLILGNIVAGKKTDEATPKPTTSTLDRVGLLSFKSYITTAKDKAYIFTSWNDSTETCHWFGVNCDAPLHPDRVTSLLLPSFGLTGKISPYLSNLSFLREINLGHNNLHGDIPSEIANLRRLRTINLTSNSLQGEIPGAFFTDMPGIQNLTLSHNKLHGEIPTNFTRGSKLQSLILWDNNFTGSIPSEIGSLQNLELLDLEENNLTGEIPPSIGNITTLRRLFLPKNNLVGHIPSQISYCTNLEILDLQSNRLSGQIPLPLFNFSSLYLFGVGDNHLTGTLPPDFGRNLPQLRYLLLSLNKFSGQIPASLSYMSKLERIQLSGNMFVGSIPSNLGSGLPNLTHLLLDNNLFSTDDWRFIDSLTNCSNLKNVDLWNNNFTGFLPESITKLSATSLGSLTLGNNSIKGEIPVMIGELSSLVTLNMEINQLTGSIPESIGKLQNLKIFAIAKNKLSGTIPDSFGNLTEMLELYMGGNELSGTIPSNFGAMKKLIALGLSYNNLSGFVPKSLFRIPTIAKFLHISHNNLTGVLPEEVGSLRNVKSFEASHNRFHGRIPESIGSCVILESLMLQGNEFDGPIPESIQNLKGLRILDLSENHLSGSIPSYMENMVLLEYLNLSNNDLEGKVPTQGVFSNASLFSIQGNEKLFTSRQHHQKLSKRSMTIIIIVVVVAVLLFIGVFLIYKYKMSSNRKRMDMAPRSGRDSWREENQFIQISYADIQKATGGFSSENLIGSGGFGSVYKGILMVNVQPTRMIDIAVKVLNDKSRAISKSFMAECNVLRNARHRNLVRILTACSSEDTNQHEFKALVYEYMPNGSLDRWLKKVEEAHGDGLSLAQRLNIAIDVASALDYLHTQTESTIVHCDLKPSNILLDVNMVAHVGDFGIAKFLSADQDQTLTTAIQGSIGYIAPECGMGSKLSTLWDVYSYGILVLEIFTCKSPTSKDFGEGTTLHQYVEANFPYGILKVADPYLLQPQEECGLGERRIYDTLVSIIRIGLNCSIHIPNERMLMKDVIKQLNAIRDAMVVINL